MDQSEDQRARSHLGLDATWVVSKRFYFDGRAQYLKVNIDDLDGSLGIYEGALYRCARTFPSRWATRISKANLISAKRSKSGFFNFNTKGPSSCQDRLLGTATR